MARLPLHLRNAAHVLDGAQPRRRRRHQLAHFAAVGAAAAAAAAAITAAYTFHVLYDKIRKHDGALSGSGWVQELLDSDSPTRMSDCLGMKKHVFLRLVLMLRKHAGLCDTRYVPAVEQVGMFLYAIRGNQSNRSIQERFQRSGSTVSTCVLWQ